MWIINAKYCAKAAVFPKLHTYMYKVVTAICGVIGDNTCVYMVTKW